MMGVSRVAFLGLIMTVVAISPALAKDGHGRGGGHGSDDSYEHREYEVETHRSSGHSSGHSSDDSRSSSSVRIGDDDRSYIHHYLEDSYKQACPPGLVKKHNGCLPPGQAKKYRIGYALPDSVVYAPVPLDILRHLRPAPSGYKYVRVDTDVLLIGEATKKVIDAVTLLSGVNNQ